MEFLEIKKLLDAKVSLYNNIAFIKDDPISIPHKFTLKQDIEIAGFFASIFAWGNRKAIINSATRLMNLMDNKPYKFIMNNKFEERVDDICNSNFVHRTFNEMDLYHLLHFLRFHYYFLGEESLETAFIKQYNFDFDYPKLLETENKNIEEYLIHFHKYVFRYDEDASEEKHCKKHISTPLKKSACKRLNMFLRWMVRTDDKNVDFGIWKTIKPSELIIPLDVHVGNVARQLGLLTIKNNDWTAALELTNNLKLFNCDDPVIYDFALFSMGVIENKI